MLTDAFGRTLESLRVSLTSHCNLKCVFCHNDGQEVKHGNLDFDLLGEVMLASANVGINRVKLSGGEPTMHPQLLDIVRMADNLFEEVSMTTNGIKLPQLAKGLKQAGLKRVNISLHATDEASYETNTGYSRLHDALAGVHAAKLAGLGVKVNFVILKPNGEENIARAIELAVRENISLQLIELEGAKEESSATWFQERHHSLAPLEEVLVRHSIDSKKKTMHGRWRHRIDADFLINAPHGLSFTSDFLEFIEKEDTLTLDIETVMPHENSSFCGNCKRLRLTSDGTLRPCLLSRIGQVTLDASNTPNVSEIISSIEQVNEARRPYWT